jgi:hypothetical protein
MNKAKRDNSLNPDSTVTILSLFRSLVVEKALGFFGGGGEEQPMLATKNRPRQLEVLRVLIFFLRPLRLSETHPLARFLNPWILPDG